MGAFLVLGLVLCIPSLYLLRKLLPIYPTLRLPPGPKGLPFIGNVFNMPDPAHKAHLHWQKFKKLYGPLSSVTVLGQTIIVLNDYDTAVELLEKNSAVFSGRAPLTFVGEMVGWGRMLPFSQYGDLLRQYRRDWHKFLGTRSAVERFMPMLEIENKRLLNRILQDHACWRDQLRKTAGSNILRVLYGYIIESEGTDPLLTIADEVKSELGQSVAPGAWAVDILPILRYLPEWVPGASFKRTAREWRNHMIEFIDRPYQFSKQCMSSGTAPPSYVSTMLSSLSSPLTAEEESHIKWGASGIYAGASESTVSAMHTFFLAMLLHPNVQREAQREIDTFVGTDRLPTAADRVRLPYVEAVLKECLRWNVVAPLALPHASDEEYLYRGYRIPKGSIILANIWEFAHDPSIYTNPEEFNPDRFLEKNGNKPEMDPRQYAFGFGRRLCPGKEFSDATVWLSAVTCLAVFNFEKVCDESGNEVTPPAEYDNGFVCFPKYFPCSIVPRSKKSEALIRSVEIEHPFEKSDSEALERVKWGEEML